ncbi:FAD-dependent oxidoreductase [Candidatus Bathyarchaeota archaeon]|nr:MAG: FAD-dependent oxidoreductase [Candidatus Bathyarchaeota archaeon]TMI60458.1 MAG: FAD-dependent oxidoreductase [Candidatus Bathyarchaeota archaeon]
MDISQFSRTVGPLEPWDVTIIGGGILGTSISYWLANQYEGRIAVVEKEQQVAFHTSKRNTGVIHRPFYLDPVNRRVFARSSQAAYGMWKSYAKERGLPWSQVTTFEVATREADVKRVEKYYHWGLENGMGEDELELLTAEEVRKFEPHVRSRGAIWSKTDTSVDYPSFTRSLQSDAEREGVRFILGFEVKSIEETKDFLEIQPKNGGETIRTRFLVNCAGGNSMRIAHMLGVGREYADLNFRGEYWEVGEKWRYLATRNIYTVAQHPELPFLDPHWICRADGRREIGPNAVPVAGPYTYRGFFQNPIQALEKILEPPMMNKIALLYNKDFLTLAGEEWKSSIFKSEMARRAQEFIPELKLDYLVKPGIAGVRAQVIDRNGNFIKEAIEIKGPMSYHITNYNSPGATGSPAYAAWLVEKLGSLGYIGLKKRTSMRSKGTWDYESVTSMISDAPKIVA